MITANYGAILIDGTFTVVFKVKAGIINKEIPPCGIF